MVSFRHTSIGVYNGLLIENQPEKELVLLIHHISNESAVFFIATNTLL